MRKSMDKASAARESTMCLRSREERSVAEARVMGRGNKSQQMDFGEETRSQFLQNMLGSLTWF